MRCSNKIKFICEDEAVAVELISFLKKCSLNPSCTIPVKNPALIAPSFQKSGTVDSCRTVPVGSIHLLGDYTLVTNQVKAASHRMATRP